MKTLSRLQKPQPDPDPTEALYGAAYARIIRSEPR